MALGNISKPQHLYIRNLRRSLQEEKADTRDAHFGQEGPAQQGTLLKSMTNATVVRGHAFSRAPVPSGLAPAKALLGRSRQGCNQQKHALKHVTQ
eukprot:273155-Pleurochrysis_carterae.AAC.2